MSSSGMDSKGSWSVFEAAVVGGESAGMVGVPGRLGR